MALASYLASNCTGDAEGSKIAGTSVIELGAGSSGVPSIVAARSGFSPVLATDLGGETGGDTIEDNLEDLRRNVEFIRQTSAGMSESRAHILGGGQ